MNWFNEQELEIARQVKEQWWTQDDFLNVLEQYRKETSVDWEWRSEGIKNEVVNQSAWNTFTDKIVSLGEEIWEQEKEIEASDDSMISKWLQSFWLKAKSLSWLVWAWISSTYSAIMPDEWEKWIADTVKYVWNKVWETSTAKQISETTKFVWDKLPEELQRDSAAVWNIVMWVIDAAWVWAVGKWVSKISLPKSDLKKKIAVIDNKIIEDYTQAIKPSTKNAILPWYNDKMKESVISIIDNKDRLNLLDEFGEVMPNKIPDNINTFVQATNNLKKWLYEEYHNIAIKAWWKATVDIKPIIKELETLKKNRVFLDNATTWAKWYIDDLIDRYKAEGWVRNILDLEQTKQWLNWKLKNFYNNPDYNNFDKSLIDAMVNNQMGKVLDDTILKATKEWYSDLKRMYWNLSTIEKDITHRGIIEARKNNVWLIDYTDIFSVGDLAWAITTGNAWYLAKWWTQFALKERYKMITSPDRKIKKVFNNTEKKIKMSWTSWEKSIYNIKQPKKQTKWEVADMNDFKASKIIDEWIRDFNDKVKMMSTSDWVSVLSSKILREKWLDETNEIFLDSIKTDEMFRGKWLWSEALIDFQEKALADGKFITLVAKTEDVNKQKWLVDWYKWKWFEDAWDWEHLIYYK